MVEVETEDGTTGVGKHWVRHHNIIKPIYVHDSSCNVSKLLPGSYRHNGLAFYKYLSLCPMTVQISYLKSAI